MDFPLFVVLTGEDKDRRFPVHPGSGHLLGRHADASYRLKDHNVARFHCMINSLEGTVTVLDQPGSGGTLVNGAAVASHDLQHGDTLQVGETVIRYLTRPMTEAELNRTVTARAEYDPHAVAALAELTGTEFSHFKLGEVLGRGSAAMVFRAKDTITGQEVALKVFQPDYATHDDDRRRFVAAMKAAMPLDHPNLVRVLGAGRQGSHLWAALELVPGESLGCVLKRVAGKADWRFAYRVAVRVGRALGYAYQHGLAHRAVSPANILIRSGDGEVKLEDLMLAKADEGGASHRAARPADLIGDVHFMSPERTTGGAVPMDHRSDLFSLGATCYAVLTGKPPFEGGTVTELVANVRTAEPLPPRKLNPGTPPPFEAVLLKLLAKHPADRYQSADDLVGELEQFGQQFGVKA